MCARDQGYGDRGNSLRGQFFPSSLRITEIDLDCQAGKGPFLPAETFCWPLLHFCCCCLYTEYFD